MRVSRSLKHVYVFELQLWTANIKYNTHVEFKNLQTKVMPAGISAKAAVSKSSGIRSQAVLTFISIRQLKKKKKRSFEQNPERLQLQLDLLSSENISVESLRSIEFQKNEEY